MIETTNLQNVVITENVILHQFPTKWDLCAIIKSAPVTLRKEYIIVEDNAQITDNESDEFSAETLRAAELFERLAPEARTALLDFLRHLNDAD